MSESIVKNKSFEFALRVIDLYKVLVAQNEYVLSKQLLRSGTSIGANIEEALAGQSKKDFAHKMSTASKEARETSYWLKLIEYAAYTDNNQINELKVINEELVKMLTAIVKTAQNQLNSNN